MCEMEGRLAITGQNNLMSEKSVWRVSQKSKMDIGQPIKRQLLGITVIRLTVTK